MPGYLLYTNVLSEVVKKRPAERVLARLRLARPDELFTSAVSAMELRHGALRHPAGQALWARLRREVLARVSILPFGEAEAERAGAILVDLESRGALIGLEDVMIGATALAAGLTAVSRNVRHLGRIRDLAVENWWEEGP